MTETHSQTHEPQQHHTQVLPPAQPQQPSNGLGIASLALGIASVSFFSVLAGIPAIITGILGLKNPASKGMSIAGIVMGVISIAQILLLVLYIMYRAAQDPNFRF